MHLVVPLCRVLSLFIPSLLKLGLLSRFTFLFCLSLAATNPLHMTSSTQTFATRKPNKYQYIAIFDVSKISKGKICSPAICCLPKFFLVSHCRRMEELLVDEASSLQEGVAMATFIWGNGGTEFSLIATRADLATHSLKGPKMGNF